MACQTLGVPFRQRKLLRKEHALIYEYIRMLTRGHGVLRDFDCLRKHLELHMVRVDDMDDDGMGGDS